jgi:hypothetical protein
MCCGVKICRTARVVLIDKALHSGCGAGAWLRVLLLKFTIAVKAILSPSSMK